MVLCYRIGCGVLVLRSQLWRRGGCGNGGLDHACVHCARLATDLGYCVVVLGLPAERRPPGSKPPWWIVLILWPLSIMSFIFMWCIFKGLPGSFFNHSFISFADYIPSQNTIAKSHQRFPTLLGPCSDANSSFGSLPPKSFAITG
jgi:hypothetical protein